MYMIYYSINHKSVEKILPITVYVVFHNIGKMTILMCGYHGILWCLRSTQVLLWCTRTSMVLWRFFSLFTDA